MDPTLPIAKQGAIRTSNPGNRERIFNMEGVEDPNENRARTTKGGNRPRRNNDSMQNDGAMAASSQSKLPAI